MKNKLQQFIVKLLAATLAIIMAVPTNVFAMSQRKSNTYTAATSVMGIQPKDDAPETEKSQETNLLKSAVSTEETTDYIIEKSANLSQTTGQVTYKIAVKTKDPSQEFTEDQTTTFGITENTDLKDLKVEKVQALDADGKEIDVKNTLNTPKAFNSTDNIRTLGITATKPQYGMVYYLSAQLTEEALKNLEEKSPQLALDITIASPNQDIFQTRYSLETTKIDTTEITIDNDGNVVNQTSDLVEKEDNLHLYKGEYKNEEKTLFQTTPAHLVWTDYINAKDDKEFTINFDLDENQNTENSQINIDYYEARDKGYVLNQSFSKTVDFTNSLNLTIPQGYIAKVSLSTAIKENTNAKEYTFNGVKVANPTYKEEKNQMTEEEQATDDADPLPDDSSKNDEETKPSNDSIADENKQDFSQNPKSDTSAIALNKEAYLEKLKDEEKLTENLEKAASDIELALESYNKEETNWDEFKATLQTIAKEQNLDQAQTEETLQALLAGLNEDKYKVANIDTKEATNLVEESTDQSEPKDATEKSVDELVKEKLNEEGITIEDFQNYMYELEEKYGLTDEDAARIYGANAETIQALAEKARQEKTTGDVLAVNNQSAFRKTYPYDIDYWTYQYYDQANNKVNWDIQIETHQVNLEYLEFNSLGLALYAPVAQGLENYTVSIMDYPGNIKKTDRSLIKEQNSPTSGITLATGKLIKTSDGLLTYNKTFEKGGLGQTKLPKNLYIHVEATPQDNHAKYQMYDLGLRLTPDKNYIQKVYEEFKDDWAKLVAAMPWIIPFKSGDGQVKKFENGFNVVDTRLPADAMVAAYQDDKYKAKSYADKSRSVFGEFTGNNTITWQISDTLRLQDDDRFVSSGKLGDDIFSTTFNSNNNTSGNVSVEVLEPIKDGSFTPILKGNYSSASAFRTALSGTKETLIPGTVINYIFTKTAKDNTNDSTATTNFSERFDDGFGTYGGEQTASIRKLSTQELEGRYHIGYQQGLYIPPFNSNPDPKLSGWQFKNLNIFRVFENYDMVFCINPGAEQPVRNKFFTDEKKFYIEKKELRKPSDIEPYLQKDIYNGVVSNTSDDSVEDIFKKLKMVFYYGEEIRQKYDLTEEEYSQSMQYAVASVAATKRASEEFSKGQGWSLGKGQEILNRVNEAESKNEWNEEKARSVELSIYANSNSNGPGGSVGSTANQNQNMITGKVYPLIKLSKISIDNTPLSGAHFELRDNNGALIQSWVSTDTPKEIFLDPGEYTVTETKTPKGEYRKLDPFKIQVVEKYDQRNNNDIPIRSDYKSDINIRAENNKDTTRIKSFEYNFFAGSQKVITETDKQLINKFSGLKGGNYYQPYREVTVDGSDRDVTSQLIAFNDISYTVSAKNIKDTQLQISKKLLAADGKYHNLPGIEFELKNKSSAETRKVKTNRNGIAVFDNLPLNSTWELKENVPKDIVVDHGVTWTVKVDGSGNVSVTPSNNDDSISKFENGVLTVINKPNIKEVLGNFKIVKVNENNPTEKLSGASFVLKDKSDKIIKNDSTDDHGTISFDNLKPGTYTLEETNAPKGYILGEQDTTRWTVEVEKDAGNVTIYGNNATQIGNGNKVEITITNKPKSPKPQDGKFKIVKKDKTSGQVLSGVEFELWGTDETGKEIQILTGSKNGKYITGNSGELYFWDLPDGIYKLKETKAKSGYVLPKDSTTTILVNNGTTSSVDTNINIDTEKSTISLANNSSVSVTDQNNKPVSVSVNDGKVDASQLNDGIYSIKDETGNGVRITVKDKKIEKIDNINQNDTGQEDNTTPNENPSNPEIRNPEDISNNINIVPTLAINGLQSSSNTIKPNEDETISIRNILSLPDNIVSGDTLTVRYSTNITPTSTTSYIVDSSGNTLASGSFNRDNTITYTFNESAKNTRNGSTKNEFRVNANEVRNSSNITVEQSKSSNNILSQNVYVDYSKDTQQAIRTITASDSPIRATINNGSNKIADVSSTLRKINDTEFDLTTTITGNSYEDKKTTGQGVDVLFLVDATGNKNRYVSKEFNRLFPTIRAEIANRFPGDQGRVNVVQFGASKVDTRDLNVKPRTLNGWRQASNTAAAPNSTFKLTENPDISDDPFIHHLDDVTAEQIRNSRNSNLNNRLIVVTITSEKDDSRTNSMTYNIASNSDDAFTYVYESYYNANDKTNIYVKNGFADDVSRVFSERNNDRNNKKWNEFNDVRSYIQGLPKPTEEINRVSYIPNGNVDISTTQDFSIISGKSANVGRLVSGESKTITTRVRLNNTNNGSHNVLGKVTIDGNSVNIGGPAVNVTTTNTNKKVDNGPDARLLSDLNDSSTNKSLLSKLTDELLSTSYAANQNQSNDKFANIKFSNTAPKDGIFEGIKEIVITNVKATYPSTGGSGTFIGFALIGTAIMLAGIAYYGIYVNDKNRRRSNRYDK